MAESENSRESQGHENGTRQETSPTLSFHSESNGSSDHLLERTEASHSQPVPLEPLSLEMPLSVGRYLLEREIARGGMGAIFRGLDHNVNRPLAFKVLLDRYLEHPHALRRFLEEAQIMGQLQHPGIAPLYERGQLPDGRPFFAMKLIEGMALHQLLRQRASHLEELSRYLRIFAQVCDTMAYAHSRGIIHRDLKPHNIMVGAFGEVQVMDWGLAKRLDSDTTMSLSSDPQGNDPSGSATEAHITESGSIVGTPAYLAPEQARGEVELVDERSDVFGLGAILYEILTGHSPFWGRTTQQMRADSAQGNLEETFEHLNACGADAELIALTRRCLHPEKEQRPRSAREVAEAIESYQRQVEDRLQQAEIERAQAQTRALEEQKRRKLAWGLAGAIVLLILGIAGGGYWVQWQQAQKQKEQARKAEEQRQVIKAAVEKVEGFIAQAQWDRAEEVIKQARGRLTSLPLPELPPLVNQAEQDLELAKKMSDLLFRRSHVLQALGERSTADTSYATVFRSAALGAPGDDPGSVAAKIRQSALRKQWIAALDDWALASAKSDPQKEEWLLEVARRADDNAIANRLRDPAILADAPVLKQKVLDVPIEQLPPEFWAVMGLRLVRLSGSTKAVLERAVKEYPGDFWLNYLLANAYFNHEPENAIGYYRAALAARPDDFGALLNLGAVLDNLGRGREALAFYGRAEKARPQTAAIHQNIGVVHLKQNDLEEAEKRFRKAISLSPKSGSLYSNLGVALARQGKKEEAIAAYEKAIDLSPEEVRGRTGLAGLLREKGEQDRAIQLCREALRLSPTDRPAFHILVGALKDRDKTEELQAAKQQRVRIEPRMASHYLEIARIYHGKKEWQQELQWLQEGAKAVPKDAKLQGVLGQALTHQGRFLEGREAFRLCLALAPVNSPAYRFAIEKLNRSRSLIQLDQRLKAIRAGKAQVNDPREWLLLAHLSRQYKRDYLTAARYYQQAFQGQPALEKIPGQQNRYLAARSAVLAAGGSGEQTEKLTEKKQAEWRMQALQWLSAELEGLQGLVGQPKMHESISQRLRQWTGIADLADVREKAKLQSLPEEEQKQWTAFWNKAKALQAKVQK